MSDLIFYCPWCNGTIVVKQNELNCKIFRHGMYKNNGKQMDPHLSKQLCDEAIENDLIHGCGKPFRVTGSGDDLITEKCDYI